MHEHSHIGALCLLLDLYPQTYREVLYLRGFAYGHLSCLYLLGIHLKCNIV